MKKMYYVESIDIMDFNKREIVGEEFKNKKVAVGLLKDLQSCGIMSKTFVLKERYVNK